MPSETAELTHFLACCPRASWAIGAEGRAAIRLAARVVDEIDRGVGR